MRYHLIRIKVIDTMSNKPFPHSNLKNIQCFIIAANNFVNDFNDIFGFSMFCVECIGIASTIEILIISVYSTNDNGFLKQIAEYVFAALFFIMLFHLSFCCQELNTTSLIFTKTCYKLHSEANRRHQEDLILLATISKEFRPVLSVKGFHNIDQKNVITLFRTMVSYMLVVFQFSWNSRRYLMNK
ncbi:unnamed protein product [Psylliodes chrysocephalus]|uniref:Uncharacterized protein n=1 Tax=Psylliodes chrysocephalus TaxID=3402493 RepID=A0A9P0DAW6_9CUCU|nr:unnamed protein product [Psylliodes chrysocephala]